MPDVSTSNASTSSDLQVFVPVYDKILKTKLGWIAHASSTRQSVGRNFQRKDPGSGL